MVWADAQLVGAGREWKLNLFNATAGDGYAEIASQNPLAGKIATDAWSSSWKRSNLTLTKGESEDWGGANALVISYESDAELRIETTNAKEATGLILPAGKYENVTVEGS
jgi:ABC-type thiamine transport system substrate-binding protein